VNEDPFTGSMQAGLFDSAKANQLLPADSRKAVIEQGHFHRSAGFRQG
jgi:predicted PhzF superfamily epimerase YddE/YHI9